MPDPTSHLEHWSLHEKAAGQHKEQADASCWGNAVARNQSTAEGEAGTTTHIEVQLRLLHHVAQGLALAVGPAGEADGAAYTLQHAQSDAQLRSGLL